MQTVKSVNFNKLLNCEWQTDTGLGRTKTPIA